MPIVFVTGVDTGCGKTHITAALSRALNQSGRSAVGFKPVASGCERTEQGLRNEDALILRQHSAAGFSYEEINPIALEPAIAPHLAADDVGVELSVDQIIAGAQRLQRKADWVLVEGAGGVQVPLNEQESFADLIERSSWPVILVVGMRLGCINHALLSAEAIAKRGQLLGWVANCQPPAQERLQDNIAAITSRISAPCVGVVRAGSIELAAGCLKLDEISEF